MAGPRASGRSSRFRGAIALTGAVALVESARAAARDRVGPTEERIFRWFNGRGDRARAPVWLVMQLGSLGAVLIASAGVACRGDRRRARLVGAVGTTLWVGVKLVKPAVGRGRPAEYLDDVVVRGARQTGLGYPSGHAAVAVSLALMVPAAAGHRPAAIVRTTAIALAGATGVARMYVGAHLPLDVVGGYVLGAGAGAAGRVWLARPS